ncbi:hypothetical protein AB835_12725 [Candidatus Endobugula sertula]|uniref:Uncharacterized protein n=1 Tax=Candidatus Endobugula sertula TaxID=62101 RepID=A0A1D2QMB3_9GAMM|nr:hypothetical protein AB835_12725 [Candidatus Endobugula sertula]
MTLNVTESLIETSVNTLRSEIGTLVNNTDDAKVSQSLGEIFGGKKGSLSVLRKFANGKDMPKIVVVDDGVFKDTQCANGAYSSDDNTIYIADSLAQTGGKELTKVLAEELGHFVDNRLAKSDKKKDATGDEGMLFANYVLKLGMSRKDIEIARKENDHGTVEVKGEVLDVEFSASGSRSAFVDGTPSRLYVSVSQVGADGGVPIGEPFQVVEQGGNSDFVYTIASRNKGKFRIDLRTGQLYFIGAASDLAEGLQVEIIATFTTATSLFIRHKVSVVESKPIFSAKATENATVRGDSIGPAPDSSQAYKRTFVKADGN